MNCGQMCSATSRLVVEQSIADEFLERLFARAASLRVGAPREGDVDMGPITTRPQFEKIRGIFDRARRDGIRCAAGGRARDDGPGLFVEPTIYADVPRDNFLWREELFGPVLAVRAFTGESEAIALANDTPFGLAATVVSGDGERALRVAEAIDAGHVWINAPQLILPESLWGGFKASGIGRELGPPGLVAYQQEKFLTMAAAGRN